MRPLRKDLIPWLLDNPRTVGQIAREYGVTPGEIADDLRHLIRSLRHTQYRSEINPARCRKCGFTFAPDKLLKPSKCPECHSNWLTEPQFCVREAPATPRPATPPLLPKDNSMIIAAETLPVTLTPDFFHPLGEREAAAAGTGAGEGGAHSTDMAASQAAEADPAWPANPAWLTPLDHTADAGFAIEAPDLPRLFERAAWGMFSLICDLTAVMPTQETAIEVEADDMSALLVRWLSELNFRHVTEHQLYGTFAVKELAEGWLVAQVGGEPIHHARHTIYTEIKAVTFHGLEITQTADGWRARVIFDL